MKTKRSFSYALLGGLSLFLAVQGCGDDSDGNDKPPVINPTAGTSAGGADDGNAGAGTGNTGNTGNTNTGGTGEGGAGATAPVGGEGQGGEPFVPECNLPELGEDGCFNCPENGDVNQWLNRCVDSDCVPFDNSRLTLLGEDGELPALP